MNKKVKALIIEDISSPIIKECELDKSKIKEILDKLFDLIIIKDIDCKFLSDDERYKELIFERYNLKLYSPRAKSHRGVMTGKSKNNHSEAEYHWIIENRGDALLIQELKPKSTTSYHYHRETRELFINVAGKVFIYENNQDKEKKGYSKILEKERLHKVQPLTAHQLKTKNIGCINVLFMQPYDAELKDHYYM